jgi:hypothetical protein
MISPDFVNRAKCYQNSDATANFEHRRGKGCAGITMSAYGLRLLKNYFGLSAAQD